MKTKISIRSVFLTFGTSIFVAVFAFLPLAAGAQTMSIEEYEPKSTLVVPSRIITRAKYPFIDIHSHIRGNPKPEALKKMVGEMDALNLKVLVNLSGRNGTALAQIVKNTKGRYPNRFVVFANISFRGIDEPGWGV